MGRYHVRVPTERKYADVSDDFRYPSVNRKENLARRMYSTLTALQQLTHIDGVDARAMMISVPQLRTPEQRARLAKILNKPIQLKNDSIQILCTSVSLAMKEIVTFVLFRGCDPLDPVFNFHMV